MKNVVVIIFLLLIVGLVGALPTTLAASDIGNNNFTLNASGANGTTFFKYGTNPARLNLWTSSGTPDGSGYYSSVEVGSPIMPSTLYYVSACDSTGCSANNVSFTTLAAVPLANTTMGAAISNMTKNRFNLLYLPANIAIPYGWLFPSDTGSQSTALQIVFGMIFFFIYVGLWLRTRSVATGVIIGLLTSSFILFSNQGLNLGIPIEFIAIAQGLLYASLAGVILAWLKK
jgi:hypothetical protein